MLTGSPTSRSVSAPLPRRSLDNLRDTERIVAGRFRRRPASYPRFSWVTWTIAWLLLTVALVVWVDPMAGRMHGHWPATPARISGVLTDLGLGGWYIVPSVACLVAANLIDWRSLSRRSLMLAYNWTAFAA